METFFMNTKNSKNNEAHRLKYNLIDKLDLKNLNNRLPILLAQIQAGNNSIKLKNETGQILYSLYRSKALAKTVYNRLIKSI